jgi:hypothetical protein
MPATTEKITDNLAARLGAAREIVDTKVVPFAAPKGRKAAKQMRHVVEEKIVPMASTAVDNALTASAPVRTEAIRRATLAAAALRGADSVRIKKRRRWPLAMVFLALGSALGGVAAWLAQAGKPVQLSPYPLAGDDERRSDSTQPHSVDLTDESSAHHPS